jgi:hypothetical protein
MTLLVQLGTVHMKDALVHRHQRASFVRTIRCLVITAAWLMIMLLLWQYNRWLSISCSVICLKWLYNDIRSIITDEVSRANERFQFEQEHRMRTVAELATGQQLVTMMCQPSSAMILPENEVTQPQRYLVTYCLTYLLTGGVLVGVATFLTRVAKYRMFILTTINTLGFTFMAFRVVVRSLFHYILDQMNAESNHDCMRMMI